jgi:hypothetical protein
MRRPVFTWKRTASNSGSALIAEQAKLDCAFDAALAEKAPPD